MLKGDSWDTAALKPINPSMLTKTGVLYQGTSRETTFQKLEKSRKHLEDTDSSRHSDALEAAVKTEQISVTPPWHVSKWRKRENKLFPEVTLPNYDFSKSRHNESVDPKRDFQSSRHKTIHDDPIGTIAEPKKTFRILKLHNPRRNH